jgi:hypothetical protein
MIYYRPKFIPPGKIPKGRRGVLWFLDEANRAHPTVIQTLFQIITERRCGEHDLPEKTAIVLSGNLGETDQTTVTEFDDSALDGRLAVFHLKPNARDWLQWADKEKIHTSVKRYVSLFPERLWDEQNINPNPRGWHQVSQALFISYKIRDEEDLSRYLQVNPETSLKKVICSLLGLEAGSDFILQHTVPRELTTSQILEGDSEKLEKLKHDEIPSEDLLWSLAGTVTHLRDLNHNAREGGGQIDPHLLGNVLKFIGYARSDITMSFFFLLIKECGLFTSIPHALEKIEDDAVSGFLLQKYESLLKPREE